MMEASVEISKSARIGEIFLEHQLITAEQLDTALRRQSKTGGRLGSILLELGFVKIDELLHVLSQLHGVHTIDLLAQTLDPEVLNELTYSQVIKYSVLPIGKGVKSLFIAMVNPGFAEEIESACGKKLQPIVVPQTQMTRVINYLENLGHFPDKETTFSELLKEETNEAPPGGNSDLWGLFRMLVAEGASDLLLTAGTPPCLKKNNTILRQPGHSLTPQEVAHYANMLMTPVQQQEFEAVSDIDFGLTVSDLGRFRINIFKQRSSCSIAVRNVMEEIPSREELGLPPWIEDFALEKQGLIMITGPAGQGKSSTLACLVDIINSRRQCNIITIEDPIEFHHKHKLSNVNQREVGRDTESFQQGLRRVFRQSPDVIVIGEMRDPESFAIALQAAETGHLVISTMHASFSTSAIERIIDIFPPAQQQQIRVQLAESFLLVLNQRLISHHDGHGRALAYESLMSSSRIKKLIREGKTHHIRVQLSRSPDEFQPMDLSLVQLVKDGKISEDEGLKYCENPALFRESLLRRIAPAARSR